MKIRIKGYLTFRNSIGEQVLELVDETSITLRNLLVRLSLERGLCDSVYLVAAGAVNESTVVLVNGRNHVHLPDHLDTALKDGDEVAIFPPMAGG